MSHFIVYKIFSEKGDKVYYGSSIAKRSPLHRFQTHKYAYKTGILRCSSKELFDEYGVENCSFQIVEYCNNKEHTRERERWYITNNDCINKVIPSKTVEEIHAYRKQYADQHKEQRKEYDIQYRKNKKEEHRITHICEICGGKFKLKHKTTHEKTKKHKQYIVEV